MLYLMVGMIYQNWVVLPCVVIEICGYNFPQLILTNSFFGKVRLHVVHVPLATSSPLSWFPWAPLSFIRLGMVVYLDFLRWQGAGVFRCGVDGLESFFFGILLVSDEMWNGEWRRWGVG